MKSLFNILFLLVLSPFLTLHSQDIYKFKGWNDSIVMQAHTGMDSDFLTKDEKKIILLQNLARLDGPRFAETFLKEYIILKDLKSNKYIRSLYQDLQRVKDLPMLIPEKDLYNAARGHATKSGVKGIEGHKGFKARYSPLMENYMEVGENIYYGDYTPEEIVLQLLIDKGIEDLGHRRNILNPRFNAIGLSIKPHKEYKYNCVMSFGLLPRSYKDYIQ